MNCEGLQFLSDFVLPFIGLRETLKGLELRLVIQICETPNPSSAIAFLDFLQANTQN